jgi:hypothetical protein
MADTERQEHTQKDLDSLIAQARGKKTLDARVALKILVEILQTHGDGFYVWAPLGTGTLATWQFKAPRTDLKNEAWLRTKVETAQLIHICRPLRFLDHVTQRNKSTSADFVGYVRDNDKDMETVETFHCTMCNRKMPLKQAKLGKIHIANHKLKQQL